MTEDLQYVGIPITKAYMVKFGNDGRVCLEFNDTVAWEEPDANVLTLDDLIRARDIAVHLENVRILAEQGKGYPLKL